MDFLAKSISEKCSDPMEFLSQLRMTTEPIGGSTKYDNNGELVEYEVAVEAVMKMAQWKDEQHKQELIRIYNFVNPYLTPEANNDLKIIIGIC